MIKLHVLAGQLWLMEQEDSAEGQGQEEGNYSSSERWCGVGPGQQQEGGGWLLCSEGRANGNCCEVAYRVCERGKSQECPQDPLAGRTARTQWP